MELTVRSETSAHKVQTPGNHPNERIQHSEHGESLKSRRKYLFDTFLIQNGLKHGFLYRRFIQFFFSISPYAFQLKRMTSRMGNVSFWSVPVMLIDWTETCALKRMQELC
jgi:hypothetical protein